MKIRTLTLGNYQTNCYLVSDEDGVTAVIDPGYEPELILSHLKAECLHLGAILLTHGHFDHVGGVKALAQAASCPVWMHEAEQTMPSRLTAGTLYYTDTYTDGDTVQVGKLTFSVMHTPGHTPGSVCLRCENALFSGDTLFAGSCGRVDLPGGSAAKMRESLKKLRAVSETLTVYPGHGEASTLERERAYNPYLR